MESRNGALSYRATLSLGRQTRFGMSLAIPVERISRDPSELYEASLREKARYFDTRPFSLKASSPTTALAMSTCDLEPTRPDEPSPLQSTNVSNRLRNGQVHSLRCFYQPQGNVVVVGG